jgi:hypothetical protein
VTDMMIRGWEDYEDCFGYVTKSLGEEVSRGIISREHGFPCVVEQKWD